MEIKTVKPTYALAFTLNTTLESLVNDIAQKPAEMINAAIANQFTITGPQIWIYEGCDGDHTKPFNLTVTVPIAENYKIKIDGYQIIELPAYKCVSITHKGPYSDFPQVYEKLMSEILKSEQKLIGSNREVYLNCDFENQENCITEIQVGIL